MQVKRCDILRLHTPFKQSFTHAQSTRSYSDKILVVVTTKEGLQGFGEVLARSYVSGETNDEVYQSTAPELAADLLGREFSDTQQLTDFLRQALASGRWGPAVFGGFELALLNAYAQLHTVDINTMLGPHRSAATGSCFTIGFECKDEQIRRYAIQAKLSGATVVKMKVGLTNDVERLELLNKAFQGKMPIRMDANGCLELEQAIELLQGARALPLQSLEQPFAADAPELDEKLRELYAQTGVPLMADESLCTPEDIAYWLESRAYQIFNIRVGKCGGLLGSVAARDSAQAAGIGVVAGTMVGESGVLNYASELFLQHSDVLDYVEGLGQNKSFLAQDPVSISYKSDDNPLGIQFELGPGVRENQLIGEQSLE